MLKNPGVLKCDRNKTVKENNINTHQSGTTKDDSNTCEGARKNTI